MFRKGLNFPQRFESAPNETINFYYGCILIEINFSGTIRDCVHTSCAVFTAWRGKMITLFIKTSKKLEVALIQLTKKSTSSEVLALFWADMLLQLHGHFNPENDGYIFL
jgi:hypothetical protein